MISKRIVLFSKRMVLFLDGDAKPTISTSMCINIAGTHAK